MKIVHISDSHISEQFPQRETDLEACVNAINSLEAAPEMVIHTGDICHDGLPEEYTTAHSLLNQLKAPFIVMGGNRDKRAALINEFADGQTINTDDAFIQYSVNQFGVRLIVIDTMSEESNKGRICSARMAHLASMLEENPTKPTVIFMHHSPFQVDAIPDPHQFERWEEVDALAALLDQHSNILGIHCGHIHRNINGTLGRHTVQAISCMAADLRKGEMSEEERTAPMLRVHELLASNST